MKKKGSKKKVWIWLGLGFLSVLGLWQLAPNHLIEAEKVLRNRVREAVVKIFPDQAAKYSKTIGLLRYENSDLSGNKIKKQTVVLIHGLDDPGTVWQNLAPELAKNGFDVWLMNYPNDQPIKKSTEFFFNELKKLHLLSIKQISIVAHSMGGLISRELLTSPKIHYHHLARVEKLVPVVEKLIMVGTPNHGSQMARLRIFTEVRDQLERFLDGRGDGLGFILDGAGEAKIDLLPGSTFLTELNSRQNPEGVDLFIIAGIAAPWSESDIRQWLAGIRRNSAEITGEEFEALGDIMITMSRGLGDGLVSVESASMPGVPQRNVWGTHLSMIRNITEASRRTPPAVPLIVETLTTNQ